MFISYLKKDEQFQTVSADTPEALGDLVSVLIDAGYVYASSEEAFAINPELPDPARATNFIP